MNQYRDVWGAAERAPSAVIQSVDQHGSGKAKMAPQLARQFDALFKGSGLSTVDAGHHVLGRHPYPQGEGTSIGSASLT
ncbi:MAG: hypothetical protein ACREFF_15800 [Candidatus Udaeobacter sp.]